MRSRHRLRFRRPHQRRHGCRWDPSSNGGHHVRFAQHQMPSSINPGRELCARCWRLLPRRRPAAPDTLLGVSEAIRARTAKRGAEQSPAPTPLFLNSIDLSAHSTPKQLDTSGSPFDRPGQR